MNRRISRWDSLVKNLRAGGVSDSGILKAMEQIDRKLFVPETFASRAYLDMPLPIARGQTISQPTVVGIMTQALDIRPNHRILEIGTGSGYQAMVLSLLALRVYTMERHPVLSRSAQAIIRDRLKRENVTFVIADGILGLPKAAPFDRIIVTAAYDDVPPALLDQLVDGGILVMPVRHSDAEQRLIKVSRSGTEIDCTDMGAVRFVPLLEGVADE